MAVLWDLLLHQSIRWLLYRQELSSNLLFDVPRQEDWRDLLDAQGLLKISLQLGFVFKNRKINGVTTYFVALHRRNPRRSISLLCVCLQRFAVQTEIN